MSDDTNDQKSSSSGGSNSRPWRSPLTEEEYAILESFSADPSTAVPNEEPGRSVFLRKAAMAHAKDVFKWYDAKKQFQEKCGSTVPGNNSSPEVNQESLEKQKSFLGQWEVNKSKRAQVLKDNAPTYLRGSLGRLTSPLNPSTM